MNYIYIIPVIYLLLFCLSLPVVAAVAIQSDFNPILLTAAVGLAASCAFMLPVATPPNAIVFGSGLIRVPQMARAGFLINILGIIIVSFLLLC